MTAFVRELGQAFNFVPLGGAAGNEGLGILSLSFDWNYVVGRLTYHIKYTLNIPQGSGGNSIGSLFTPLAAQLSLYAGCVICMYVSFVAPIFAAANRYIIDYQHFILRMLCSKRIECGKFAIFVPAAFLLC